MPDIQSKLLSKLQEGDELERCGLVLQSGRVIEVENCHAEPRKGFTISASDMHKHINKLAGTWHTHPRGGPALSQDDYLGFAQWPGLIHYIVGRGEVLAYIADEKGVVSAVD